MGNESTLVDARDPILIFTVLSHTLRVAIALLLIVSGLLHLQNVPSHFVAIANYRIVAVEFAQFLGLVLPSIHVAVGVMLLLSEFRWQCYLTSAGLLGIYCAAQFSVIFRGLRIDCGCLGPSISSSIGIGTISKTLVLLAVSLWLYWQERDRPRFRTYPNRTNSRNAMTLIELMVCISIIGILVSIILPAVQSARESARQTLCINNQRQLALAAQIHEGVFRKFPSGGWGYNWVGMSDQGTGKKQPGSWMFSLLPYLEQKSLWSMSPTSSHPHSRDEFQKYVLARVSQLTCPSKGLSDPMQANASVVYRYGSAINSTARSDYAVNTGDVLLENNAGPASLNDTSFVWAKLGNPNGMAFVRSEIAIADVTDGITNVIYCGEKWSQRPGVADRGYDQPWSTGDSQEVRRFTHDIFLHDGSSDGGFERFGSVHSAGCVFAFVDGSVRVIHFSVYPTVFKTLGNRFDGNIGVESIW